jgi:hypothetical protein
MSAYNDVMYHPSLPRYCCPANIHHLPSRTAVLWKVYKGDRFLEVYCSEQIKVNYGNRNGDGGSVGVILSD